MAKTKLSKTQKRRLARKNAVKGAAVVDVLRASEARHASKSSNSASKVLGSENDGIQITDDSIKDVFAKFSDLGRRSNENDAAVDVLADGDAGVDAKSGKSRKRNRTTLAQLKLRAPVPALVEAHDVNAPDPDLLAFLKAYPGAVGVPRHWSSQRKYLQGKRGFDRGAFELPEFIRNTGISKVREALHASDEPSSSLRSTLRDKVQAKLGRVDIDYQVLYDAFFKDQKPPKTTRMGELFVDRSELDSFARMSNANGSGTAFIPGILSQNLRNALGMHDETVPPPWLFQMQRIGTPPSYPDLKVPGINAPLPPGASFGYQPGGWGEPPADQYGRPLFPEVHQNPFHAAEDGLDATAHGVQRPNALWGDYESEPESENDEHTGEDVDEDRVVIDPSIVVGKELPPTTELAAQERTSLPMPPPMPPPLPPGASMVLPPGVEFPLPPPLPPMDDELPNSKEEKKNAFTVVSQSATGTYDLSSVAGSESAAIAKEKIVEQNAISEKEDQLRADRKRAFEEAEATVAEDDGVQRPKKKKKKKKSALDKTF